MAWAQGPAQRPAPKLSLAYTAVSNASDSLLLTVRVELAPGWSINSTAPLDSFLVPTRLDVAATTTATANAASAGLEFGPPRFPEPVLEYSQAVGGNLALYQGAFQVRVPARLKTKPHGVLRAPPTRVVLHYQSCNGSMCYPPKEVAADWPGGEVTGKLPGEIKN